MRQVYERIKQVAPEAEEQFAYSMPAFRLDGPRVYVGGFAKHGSLLSGSTVADAFGERLKPYLASKGTLKFSYDEAPLDLIADIVRFHVAENRARQKA